MPSPVIRRPLFAGSLYHRTEKLPGQGIISAHPPLATDTMIADPLQQRCDYFGLNPWIPCFAYCLRKRVSTCTASLDRTASSSSRIDLSSCSAASGSWLASSLTSASSPGGGSWSGCMHLPSKRPNRCNRRNLISWQMRPILFIVPGFGKAV